MGERGGREREGREREREIVNSCIIVYHIILCTCFTIVNLQWVKVPWTELIGSAIVPLDMVHLPYTVRSVFREWSTLQDGPRPVLVVYEALEPVSRRPLSLETFFVDLFENNEVQYIIHIMEPVI